MMSKNARIMISPLRISRAAIIILLLFLLFSCTRQNHLTDIFQEWLLVEKEELSLTEFLDAYKEFQSTAVYENMKISGTYSHAMNALDKAVKTKDKDIIRLALLNLEKLDKEITLNSNQKYAFLSQALFALSSIILIILLFVFKNYEKKRNEAKQMGIYSHFMIKGIEAERARISKEIHDSVLQDIKALSLKYEMIDTDDANAKLKLKKELLTQTDSCIKNLRSICNNLTPVEFKNYKEDTIGLILAVKNLANQFTERTKIPCILKIPENLELSSITTRQSVNLFRIIQEALNNIEKHANATMTSVIITNGNNQAGQKCLKVYITDNGQGFDSKLVLKNLTSNYGHFGLNNMKERAKDLSAEIHFESTLGEGTEIKLEMPLK